MAAGLVPAIRAGAVPGSERWVVISMQPGRHPWQELEAALPRSAADQPAEGRLLLVVDQFEELFSATDAPERQRFLREVTSLVTGLDDAVRVVLTLRGDFYDRPLLDAEFGPVFASSVVNVLPMTAAELEAAVVRPAQRVGVEVDPALVAELVVDAAAQPGALPLLQYALTDLFERRVESSLTKQEYRAMGGLQGLLSRRSEEIYSRLDAGHQQIAFQAFLRLVRLGQGTKDVRRRRPLESSPRWTLTLWCCRRFWRSSGVIGCCRLTGTPSPARPPWRSLTRPC
jgi:hypothetical protein